MSGEYLSIENAKKIENYDKLEAKYTEIKSNYEILKQLHKNLMREKDKRIEELRKSLKEANDELYKLKLKQIDLFGENNET